MEGKHITHSIFPNLGIVFSSVDLHTNAEIILLSSSLYELHLGQPCDLHL